MQSISPVIAAAAAAICVGGNACDGASSPPAKAPVAAEVRPDRATETSSKGFTQPSEAKRRRAIGATNDPTFAPGDDFAPIRAPAPGDWLDEHKEPGQTFDQFVRSKPNVPTKARRTIYLAPVGELSANTKTLAALAGTYYGLPVVVLDPLDLVYVGATSRKNPHTGQTQLLTVDILRYLKSIVPKDAYALIALTDVDLYPDESWNFVFGQASLRDRVGVYSFARYGDEDATLTLRRSAKVMVHELGHMFGLQHCVYFECILDGTNHLEETDARPMHACPVCLHKLQHSIGFDAIERYRALAALYRELHLDQEADWVEGRLRTMGANAN